MKLMACAFGMEACKQYYNTRYVRMPDLLMDLDIARTEGNYRKVMAKYSNPVLLILDEWMLLKPTDTEQKDIFELLHRRRKKSSTIFCSQYVFEEWYDQLGGEDSPLADIQSDIPLGNIFCIQADDFFKVCDVASAADLPHSGDSRLDCDSGTVVQLILFQLIGKDRAGS